MKCVTTQHFTDGVELYGMVYEPDNIPKEWKSEIVLEKRMTATDYSEKMLAVARRGIVPSNLIFERADVSNLQYDDESFDVVIIANALHVIPNPEKVLSEIKRVLKKDGLLIAPNFIHDNTRKVSDFSGDSSNKVHAARKILGENIVSDISIEELSDKVELNRTTLQRVFKQMYGVTIFEYRTQVRMQEAKNLLIEDELSITEIAGICGYSNASKFSAAFKKLFGVTPTEWKKN